MRCPECKGEMTQWPKVGWLCSYCPDETERNYATNWNE